ncbi:hypothetical protein NUW54_g13325 [Trametes sanguinea]|uniref:Uncharacterized protein n=1 Tax=Trametes sanguinea TaxID=158606 RepID=A0ACC1MM99_9APHY|nr:hypothetical protein NUW54_g13325 [Trametes sanguinea]
MPAVYPHTVEGPSLATVDKSVEVGSESMQLSVGTTHQRNPEPVHAKPYVRQVRTAPRSERNPGSSAKSRQTAWFETRSNDALANPPDLTQHGELELGDLYYHRYGEDFQLWLWTDEGGGDPRWKPVWIGYPKDGRKLTLTEGLKRPSWIGGGWYNKRGLADRLSLRAAHNSISSLSTMSTTSLCHQSSTTPQEDMPSGESGRLLKRHRVSAPPVQLSQHSMSRLVGIMEQVTSGNAADVNETGLQEILVELNEVNEGYAQLRKMVLHLERAAQVYNTRMGDIEGEVAALKDEYLAALDGAKATCGKAERTLVKERKALESIEVKFSEGMTDLKKSRFGRTIWRRPRPY